MPKSAGGNWTVIAYLRDTQTQKTIGRIVRHDHHPEEFRLQDYIQHKDGDFYEFSRPDSGLYQKCVDIIGQVYADGKEFALRRIRVEEFPLPGEPL